MTILVATQNPGKLKEISTILADAGVAVTDPVSQNLANLEVEETGQTFAENALLKAKAFSEASSLPAVGDDSGLEVAALNGQPGVYSKRFAPGSDTDRNHFLLAKLEGQTNRQALFKTILCLYNQATGLTEYFEGVLSGQIGTQLKGDQGFGYDPIFIPDGYTQTLAELGPSVKNIFEPSRISG